MAQRCDASSFGHCGKALLRRERDGAAHNKGSQNGIAILKTILQTLARGPALAALLAGGVVMSGKAAALEANAPTVGVAAKADAESSRELMALYLRDIARSNCGPTNVSDDNIADAIFMAEARSGLDATELDKLHAKAEAMSASDPSFCSKARSAFNQRGSAG